MTATGTTRPDLVLAGGSIRTEGTASSRRGAAVVEDGRILAVVGVLDRGPFAGAVQDVASATVVRTFVSGRQVYMRGQ